MLAIYALLWLPTIEAKDINEMCKNIYKNVEEKPGKETLSDFLRDFRKAFKLRKQFVKDFLGHGLFSLSRIRITSITESPKVNAI